MDRGRNHDVNPEPTEAESRPDLLASLLRRLPEDLFAKLRNDLLPRSGSGLSKHDAAAEVQRQATTRSKQENLRLAREFVRNGRHFTAKIRAEELRQVQLSFRLLVGFASAGMLLIMAAVLILILKRPSDLAPATVSGVSGLLSHFIAGVFLAMHHRASARLASTQSHILRFETVGTALRVIDMIADPGNRDAALCELARSLRL